MSIPAPDPDAELAEAELADAAYPLPPPARSIESFQSYIS